MRKNLMLRDMVADTDLLRVLEDELNTSFQKTFHSFSPVLGRWIPPVDMVEKDDSITICMDLPGMEIKDITIDFADNCLTVSGSREDIREESNERTHVWRREVKRGEFSRMFRLPERTTREDITASYNAGILTINVKKSPALTETPSRIEISTDVHQLEEGSGEPPKGKKEEKSEKKIKVTESSDT